MERTNYFFKAWGLEAMSDLTAQEFAVSNMFM